MFVFFSKSVAQSTQQIEVVTLSEPKIETFSLNELDKDSKFNELKSTYRILQNNTLAKSKKDNSFSARLVDTLGITIEANSIKRISNGNYVSYTMLMIEPNDTSKNFSNLVIQENNGIKRIFTVRYFSYQPKSKSSSYDSKSSTESFGGDIQMRSGINSFTEPWGTQTVVALEEEEQVVVKNIKQSVIL